MFIRYLSTFEQVAHEDLTPEERRNIHSSSTPIDEEDDDERQRRVIIPEDPTQIPLYFIGGILGTGEEFIFVAPIDVNAKLKKKIGRFKDQLVDPPAEQYSVDPTNLTTHAEYIAKQMFVASGRSHLPTIIVAYSFGCTLAYHVGIARKKLSKKLGFDVPVTILMIDGPSPNLTKQYFADTSNPYIVDDFIRIINHAGKRVFGVNFKEVTLPVSAIQQLQMLPRDECILNIANRAISLQGDIDPQSDSVLEFHSLIERARQNCLDILAFSPNPHKLLDKVDHIALILTTETANKYYSPSVLASATHMQLDAGWSEYAMNFENITTPSFAALSHMDILGKNNSSQFAFFIHNYLARLITQEMLGDALINYGNRIKQLKRRHQSDTSLQTFFDSAIAADRFEHAHSPAPSGEFFQLMQPRKRAMASSPPLGDVFGSLPKAKASTPHFDRFATSSSVPTSTYHFLLPTLNAAVSYGDPTTSQSCDDSSAPGSTTSAGMSSQSSSSLDTTGKSGTTSSDNSPNRPILPPPLLRRRFGGETGRTSLNSRRLAFDDAPMQAPGDAACAASHTQPMTLHPGFQDFLKASDEYSASTLRRLSIEEFPATMTSSQNSAGATNTQPADNSQSVDGSQPISLGRRLSFTPVD